MSPPGFTAAAIIIAATALAHSILGERYILMRLMRRDQPELFGGDAFTKRTLRFAWHALTIAWWGIAAALLLIPSTGLGIVTIWILAATALLTIIVSRGQHLSWVAELAAIGALLTDVLR